MVSKESGDVIAKSHDTVENAFGRVAGRFVTSDGSENYAQRLIPNDGKLSKVAVALDGVIVGCYQTEFGRML